jgi:peptide/nickel transport system substrate-binding protein
MEHSEAIANLAEDVAAGRLDRRAMLGQAAALGVTAGALLAMGASAPEAGAATPTRQAAPAKTLRVQFGTDVTTWDPANYKQTIDQPAMHTIYEGLIGYKPGTNKIANVLADRFTVSADGKSVHFRLKKGIQFHGGYGEVTADDVKYSFERIAGLTKPNIKSAYSGDWAALKQVKVIDKYSGVILLKEPFAPLLRTTLPLESGYVLSKRALIEKGAKYAQHPIGTAGYEFGSWQPGQKIVFNRFAGYGGASNHLMPPPAFSSIEASVITDPSAIEVALHSKAVDFAQLHGPSVKRFQRDSGFSTAGRTTVDFSWVGLNSQHPDLQDINLRQAIRYGVDLDAIITAAFDGLATRGYAIIPKGMGVGYWANAPRYQHNVDKAKSYLAKVANAPRTLTLTSTNIEPNKTAAQIVQANLKDVGLDLKLNLLNEGAWTTFMTDNKNVTKELQLFYGNFTSAPDPFWSIEWFTCDEVPVWNWMRSCNPAFDRLNKEGTRTLDPAKRTKIYIEMQKLMDQAVDANWAIYPTNDFAWRKGVVTPSLSPIGRFMPRAFRPA